VKVLLVNPPRFNGTPVIREERCEITERYSVLEPYSLLQLAAILRGNGHEVSLLDANGFDLGFDEIVERVKAFGPDILVFRFTPTTFDQDIKICGMGKAAHQGMKTLGLCWTLVTVVEEVMREATDLDYFIIGDYEAVVPALVESLGRGEEPGAGVAWRDASGVKVNPTSREMIPDLSKLPIPAYDLLPSLDPYFINTPTGDAFTIMYTSRGCPYRCIYCTVAGTVWKPKSAESVLAELRFLKKTYGVKLVSFFDETFTIDKQRVMDICKAMVDEKLGIKWYCNTRANLLDDELLGAMRAAGCRGMSIGVESGSQKILDTASKRISIEEAKDVIKMAKRNGIKVLCSFIFGLPGENWQTVGETIRFVRDTLPTGVQFNVAVPYPGTMLHEWAREKGFLKDVDWRHLYQHESVVGTEEMTPTELDRARVMAYRSVYTNPFWILENVRHVARNPEDFQLAARYAIKVINNLVFHGMRNAH
jgi:anaerobic magnesium-protoporphyrin IX monomethyl ester cyclase